ncbi:MAG: YfhO family protein, partial [Planctomycetaceae bacterium]|nr:YfhO family protein [Planctomycetaceae bacterium]
GWFSPRTCVEWAIIGGTWLPAALWCAESFLASRRWRYAIGLSGVLAVQLLAGHFQIAWFTLLLLAVYVPARAWWIWDNGSRLSALGFRPGTDSRSPKAESRKPLSQPRRVTTVAFAAMLCGLGLAAVQLAPTFELKQRSQRATVGKEHELDFGSIPPWYWTQVFRPSHWYSPLTDREAAFRESPPLGHSRTNSAEAHLYFGLAPLLLFGVCVVGLLRELVARRSADRFVVFWLAVAIVSGLYTSGWLLPLTRHLPGFSYFQGLGRYGLLTTWAVAVLAGSVADRFLREPDVSRRLAWTLIVGSLWSLSAWYLLGDDVAHVMMTFPTFNPLSLEPMSALGAGPLMSVLQLFVLMAVVIGVSAVLWWLSERPNEIDVRVGLMGLVLLTTSVEFWTISRLVTFTQMVESPPLKSLEQSPVRQKLLEAAQTRPTLRLFAPGANLPSTLGVSSAPIYLTFGPAEYVDDSLRQQDDWMRRGGVTHLLSFEPQPLAKSMQLIWQGDDPFLNRAWGRSGQPLYLYELEQPLGRLQLHAFTGEVSDLSSWKMTAFESRANSVECSVDLTEAGVLVLTDLDYPGWSVTVDGHAAKSIRIDKLFRGVRLEPGSHRVVWSYRPRSVLLGAVISVVTLLMLAAAAYVRFWHPQRLAWLDEANERDKE